MSVKRGKQDEPAAASESAYGDFADGMPVIVWRSRPDNFAVEFWNRCWYDYTGLSTNASLGDAWQTAIHPEDAALVHERWRQAAISQQACECEARLQRSDGVYRWFLLRHQPIADERGSISHRMGTAIDVEALKQAQEKLRRDEQEFHAITDAIAQYIVVLSPNGRVIYTNRVVFERTGVVLEDVAGEGAFAVPFHPDDVERVRQERQTGLASGVPFELEVRVRLRSGEYRWHLVQYNPQRDANGTIFRWYATGTDIDSRKKAAERLQNENLALREDIDQSSMFGDIVGTSEIMRKVLRDTQKVAPSEATVLILGETGTGKELVARAVHRNSRRAGRAFIRVNCAAIPDSLIASELFGHEKGAFTGAMQRRAGRFEAADGGTLFLDEVGELPEETQVALLRVLQEREFERIGSNHPISVDVRLIAATNRDLTEAVAAGTFRMDLFYRLNVFPIQVPPLRERRDDIPLLVEYFVKRFADRMGKNIQRIQKDTLAQLQGYRWPGNIRELQNVVERGVILSEGDTFWMDESWLQCDGGERLRGDTRFAALAEQEAEMIAKALAESGGRVSGPSGAAAKLGIPRQTLESKMKKLGIDRYGRKGQSSL